MNRYIAEQLKPRISATFKGGGWYDRWKTQKELDTKPSYEELGDDTSKVVISGGNITAGTIASQNEYSKINLDDGSFSFGDGALTWEGETLRIGKNNSLQSDIDGKATPGYVDGKVDTAERIAKQHADAVAKSEAELAEAEAKEYANNAIDDIEVGGRNLFKESDIHTINAYVGSGSQGPLVGQLNFANGRTTIVIEIEESQTYSISYKHHKVGDRMSFGFYNSYNRDDVINATIGKFDWWNFPTENAKFENYKAPSGTKYLILYFSYASNLNAIPHQLKIEKGNKATDWSPAPEDVSLDINKKTYNPVRYIRDWANGSTSNSSNHWYEIQAYANGENLARGKSVSGDTTSAVVTDGNTAGTYASAGTGLRYVQVDLGRVYYNIDSVKVWRYHLDGRRYHETKTEVSADGVNWAPIFDSLIEGEYSESSAGRSYPNTQAKSESLIANQETVNRLGDKTSRTIIDGGNITTGRIQSKNNYSNIDLDNGSFSFGNGTLTWNGGTLKIGKDNSLQSDIDGKATPGYVDGKAETAETNAKSHADDKARTLSEDIEKTKKYVQSRGENLVTNGTGLMGDNTNFNGMEFDGFDAYSSTGSFTTSQYNTTKMNDELIPVNPELTYRMTYFTKANPYVGARAYGMIMCYDSDGKNISPNNTMYEAGTLTELSRELKNGDTIVYLKDAKNWLNNAGNATHRRSFIFWNYKNSHGYQYPELTYSRNISGRDAWLDGGVDYTNNTIKLKTPWNRGTYSAGTKLSNGSSGGTYKYISGANYITPSEWGMYTGTISGIDESGRNVSNKFHPATASVKIGWLLNRGTNGGKTWLSNISFNIDYDGAIESAKSVADEAKSTLDSKSSAWDAKATTGYVDEKARTAESSAKSHADSKANAAESNAKKHADNVAKAEAELAETQAKAYADGVVTDEEQARINEAKKNLEEAKKYADQKDGSLQENIDGKQNKDGRLDNIVKSHNLLYEKDIVLYGDSDKYYPVYVRGGDQNLLRTIKIWRSYSEQAPNDWYSSTHKGSLMLTWKGNFGGWGGAAYKEYIEDHSSQYTPLLADLFRSIHSMGYTFMLRGGGSNGAIYHMASDQPLDRVETYYEGSSEIVYDHATPSYIVYAVPPMTAVNKERIEELKLAKIKEVNEVDEKATDAKEKTDAWSWNDTVEIDGGAIRAKTIQAEAITTNTLDSISANLGTIRSGRILSNDNAIDINLDTGLINLRKPIKILNRPVQTDQDVERAIDDIEVGGRNLLIQSQFLQNQAVQTDSGEIVDMHGANATRDFIPSNNNNFVTVSRKNGTSNSSGTEYLDYFKVSAYNESFENISVQNSGATNSTGATLPPKTYSIPEGTSYLLFSSSRGDLYNLKVEFGNKATDWTPAPEDTDKTIDDKTQAVSKENLAQLDEEISSVRADADASYAKSEDFENFQTEVTSSFETTNKGFEMNFKENKDLISQVEGQLEQLDSEIEKYIRFENGEIKLGAAGSETEIIISNESIDFMQGGDKPVAYIEGQEMKINRGIFVDSATIAGFKFETLSDDPDVLGVTWTS